jgi:dipeptidyl aminopeptidase/acylaminoacyl peptidase
MADDPQPPAVPAEQAALTRMARKKTFTVDDLWKVERIAGVSLSPDGTQAVCSVTRHAMDDNNSSASLWLLSTTGGKPRRLTSSGDKDGQPAWSPRGDRIAFIARREQEGRKDDTPQLYVIAPDGGEARRASDFAPGVDAFKWFPDGKRIAFVSWVWPDARGAKGQAKRHKAFKERKESGYVTTEAQYRHWDHNLPMGRVPHLHVLDVDSGRVKDLFEGTGIELQRADPDDTVFDVSPDGKRIVFVHDPLPQKQSDHCKALAEVDVASGRVRTLAEDSGWDFETPRYSPDGRRIAFTASHQARKHTMPYQIALLERGKAWKVVGAQWDHTLHPPLKWDGDGRSLLVMAEDRARVHLWRFDPDAGTADVVARGGWMLGFDAAADVVVTASDAMDHPARVHAVRDGEAPVRVERFNDELLAQFRFGETQDITVAGAQGDPVQVWLVYPPGFDRKKKYPLLHAIHGGPHTASGDTFHYRWNNQVFAAQGYVVACVNYHGSTSFGHAFMDSITHRWGELELQDIEAATDWLVKRPWIDRRRVYATGGSYGGYLVAWMNGHVAPGRYRAYVCHAGCFDWVAMTADDMFTGTGKALGAWYWDDPAKVLSQSPHAFAKAMGTPTLVVHGAMDYRVPDAQGLAYYNTLKARGVDARLLWFPDENHWILKPRNSRLWYGEFFDWLKKHG